MVNVICMTVMPKDSKQYCGELHKALHMRTRRGPCLSHVLNRKLFTAQIKHRGEAAVSTHRSKQTTKRTQVSPALV